VESAFRAYCPTAEPASHNKASFCGESQNAVFEFAKGAIFGGMKATP
jgi:hypothetical protein